MTADQATERSRSLDRLLTFIDAIVAIAITLLVLPLVDLVGELGNESVVTLLSTHLSEIGAFLLSFVVIANAWLAQHRVVRGLVGENTLIVRLLVLWTLTIVILPFPTALVSQRGHEPVTKILYIGTMALTSAVLAVLCWAIGRTRAVRDSDARPDPAHAIGSTIGYVVALAISLIFVRTGYYPLLVLLLTDRIIWWWRRRDDHGRPVRPR